MERARERAKPKEARGDGTPEDFDAVVIGSGVCGLFTAALLAADGARVAVVEKHYRPGGYAHSFRRKGFWFCAGLHYVFNSLPDEDGGLFLERIGLADEITFSPMDDDGFDVVRFPSVTHRVRRGARRNIEALAEHFPESKGALQRYYDIVKAIYVQAFEVPVDLPLGRFVAHPVRFRHLLRYRSWTTQQLFDHLGLPQPLQDVLSGQCGNIGLPPERSSLIAHAINVMAYDQGACYATKSYFHMIRTVERFIKDAPGCAIYLNDGATRLLRRGDRITEVQTQRGRRLRGEHVIFNADPKLLSELVDDWSAPAWFSRRLDYEYSPPSFTFYIGLTGIDLRAHGFGNHNVWHYPDHDINAIYRRQLDDGDLRRPFLAITTPTLHGEAREHIAPPGGEQMVICTWTGYRPMNELWERDRDAYYREKAKVEQGVLDLIEREYVPGLRDHIAVIETGSPTTNEHYCNSPFGNSYGASMTPRHVSLGKIDGRTPFANLRLVNATTGMPGLGGGFRSALCAYARLKGDRALLARVTQRRALRDP